MFTQQVNIMNHNRSSLRVLAISAICVVLAGCGAEILTATAIRGELGARQAKSAVKQLDYAKGKVGALNIDQAVQTYRAEHGANPPSLEALVPQYLPEIPQQADGTPYHYDPVSGKLSATPPAGGISQEDQRMMSAIHAAINAYGTATGYYPSTLDTLYPQYLSQMPRTSTGQPFLYNNQNGQVTHPAQQATGRTPAQHVQPVAGGGAGPMGEVMTGIGIQQELGRMSTGGASAAQSRARGGVDNTSNQHTSQQMQVMDQLGL